MKKRRRDNLWTELYLRLSDYLDHPDNKGRAFTLDELKNIAYILDVLMRNRS